LIAVVCIALGVAVVQNRADAPKRWEAGERKFPRRGRRPSTGLATCNEASGNVVLLAVGLIALVPARLSVTPFQTDPLPASATVLTISYAPG
jgi:hypothetical protein